MQHPPLADLPFLVHSSHWVGFTCGLRSPPPSRMGVQASTRDLGGDTIPSMEGLPTLLLEQGSWPGGPRVACCGETSG